MKPENNEDWRRLWENREALPPTSHRKVSGSLLVGLKKLLGPLGDFLLSSRLETQREFNLRLLEEVERLAARLGEVAQELSETRDGFQAELRALREASQKSFDGLQQEVLTLRDEKIPAMLEGQNLGLKGADMKAEWALARIIQLRQMLEQGASLLPEGRAAAARGLVYAQFEDEFRGTPQDIREKQKPYVKELSGKGKVLDLGCGRGEFLELLKENGIPCLGVERDPAMAALLKEKGLPFVQDDAFSFFDKPDGEFGAVTAFHVIEHFESDGAFSLLRKIASRLKEGGVLILETPNPASLAAYLNFHKDPGHKTPWHPDTLKFYLTQAGFKKVRIEFLHPFPPRPELKLPQELSDLLWGCQDYAAIATR